MNEVKKKKMGRPVGTFSSNPANKMLSVKVTQTQLDTYKVASERDGKTFSAWVRDVLDGASK